MKISILTPTYNRADDLERLYTSLIVNNNSGVNFEWLIMDDGSTDKTKIVVESYINQGIIDIKYYYQENQGKMVAINNLIKKAKGSIAFTCDSDDYLVTGALDTIMKYSDRLLKDDTVYALAFLKETEKGKISGNKFSEDIHRSDMFSLYFREEMTGEKILVFKTSVRKKYMHELEADEKFITESRMYHKMDLDYDVIGINEPIEIGDYKDDGYTNNILKVFQENPLGYYMFFKEILEMNLEGVSFSKRMYIYKHYILFANLAYRDHVFSSVEGIFNKIMVMILWIPGRIATKKKFKIDETKNEYYNSENEEQKESD